MRRTAKAAGARPGREREHLLRKGATVTAAGAGWRGTECRLRRTARATGAGEREAECLLQGTVTAEGAEGREREFRLRKKAMAAGAGGWERECRHHWAATAAGTREREGLLRRMATAMRAWETRLGMTAMVVRDWAAWQG